MATQTFGFIKGNKIENALRYKLYEQTGAIENGTDEWHHIATQEIIQPFNIIGSINDSGKPGEKIHGIDFKPVGQYDQYDENHDQPVVTPIIKESPEGFKYYLRFYGQMEIRTNNNTFTNVPFDCVKYLDSGDAVKLVLHGTIFVTGSSLEMAININGEESSLTVRELDPSHNIIEARPHDTMWIASGADEYARTTYIPIDSLTNDLHGACVCFHGYVQSGNPMYLIVFFDENFNRITYADYNRLQEFLGEIDKNEEIYLTVEQVKELATEDTKYVIFQTLEAALGHGPANETDLDKVSVGNIYFPLFNFKYEDFKSKKGIYRTQYILSVVAEGDGLFFMDSNKSDSILYTRETSDEPVG